MRAPNTAGIVALLTLMVYLAALCVALPVTAAASPMPCCPSDRSHIPPATHESCCAADRSLVHAVDATDAASFVPSRVYEPDSLVVMTANSDLTHTNHSAGVPAFVLRI